MKEVTVRLPDNWPKYALWSYVVLSYVGMFFICRHVPVSTHGDRGMVGFCWLASPFLFPLFGLMYLCYAIGLLILPE